MSPPYSHIPSSCLLCNLPRGAHRPTRSGCHRQTAPAAAGGHSPDPPSPESQAPAQLSRTECLPRPYRFRFLPLQFCAAHPDPRCPSPSEAHPSRRRNHSGQHDPNPQSVHFPRRFPRPVQSAHQLIPPAPGSPGMMRSRPPGDSCPAAAMPHLFRQAQLSVQQSPRSVLSKAFCFYMGSF